MIKKSMRWIYSHKIGLLLILLVFVLGFLVRFISLGSTPSGLYPDETAIGYNAYSILESGKDEYGVPYPLYFKSFDDYKLPVYIYSTAFFIKLFGPSEFSVRITSALFGSIAVVAVFFLIHELSKNKLLAGICSFFLAVNPWHSFFSRAGYEVNVATTCILLGVLFFVFAIKRKNNLLLFSLSVLFIIISVYTYNVTRLIAPLILLSLVIYYFKQLTSRSKIPLLVIIALTAIGMLPFLLSFISLQNQEGFSSHQDALIIGNAVKADIIQTRSYFIELPQVVQKILFNYWTLVGFTYLKNLVAFFSTSFYFITGSDKPNQNIYGMAMFYYFELPLLLYGAYIGIKKRSSFLTPIALWILIVFIFGSIVKIVPNGTRTFPLVIPLTILSAYGFYEIMQRIFTIKKRFFKYSFVVTIFLLIAYSYAFYFTSYFVRYPVERAMDWRSEDKKTVEFVRSIEKNYDHIVFEQSSEFFYTSLLYYGQYSPEKHHQDQKYELSGLVNRLVSTGKYEFKTINWKSENPQPGTLYITGKNNVAGGIKILKEITYPTRPVALYYDRKIGQLSVTDTAYVIFEVAN